MKGWHAKAGNLIIFRIDYSESGKVVGGNKFLDRWLRVVDSVDMPEVPARISAEPGKA